MGLSKPNSQGYAHMDCDCGQFLIEPLILSTNSLSKISHDTVLRDIQQLLDKGILKKSEKSGRSQTYELAIINQMLGSGGEINLD